MQLFPVGIQVRIREMIVVAVLLLGEKASRHHRLAVYCVHTGHTRATGSKDANMPTFGTMGASFSAWQSQFGDTSTTRLTWKLGRPFRIARVYSAIFLFKISFASSYRVFTASTGQAPIQRPQPTHLFVSMEALRSVMVMALWAQFLWQEPAANAGLPDYKGLAGIVHFHLACPGAAPHTDVL